LSLNQNATVKNPQQANKIASRNRGLGNWNVAAGPALSAEIRVRLYSYNG